MSRTRSAVLAGVLTAALAVPTGIFVTAGASPPPHSRGGGSGGGGGGQVVGLVDGTRLVAFNPNNARSARQTGTVSGLSGGDTRLVGLDYRVQDGRLYGVGDAGGVYTIATPRGAATLVNRLTVPLEGSSFGVDFNPAADRLRIISDTGQNLRHNVNPGGTTIADGRLTYPPSTAPATGVTAAAYTNNDLDPTTGTTLFDIDTDLDQVAIQSPANAGTLAATGALGVDAARDAGFDIDTRNRALATLGVKGSYRLYPVDLLTGSVGRSTPFPRDLQVSEIAIPIRR